MTAAPSEHDLASGDAATHLAARLHQAKEARKQGFLSLVPYISSRTSALDDPEGILEQVRSLVAGRRDVLASHGEQSPVARAYIARLHEAATLLPPAERLVHFFDLVASTRTLEAERTTRAHASALGVGISASTPREEHLLRVMGDTLTRAIRRELWTMNANGAGGTSITQDPEVAREAELATLAARVRAAKEERKKYFLYCATHAPSHPTLLDDPERVVEETEEVRNAMRRALADEGSDASHVRILQRELAMLEPRCKAALLILRFFESIVVAKELGEYLDASRSGEPCALPREDMDPVEEWLARTVSASATRAIRGELRVKHLLDGTASNGQKDHSTDRMPSNPTSLTLPGVPLTHAK